MRRYVFALLAALALPLFPAAAGKPIAPSAAMTPSILRADAVNQSVLICIANSSSLGSVHTPARVERGGILTVIPNAPLNLVGFAQCGIVTSNSKVASDGVAGPYENSGMTCNPHFDLTTPDTLWAFIKFSVGGAGTTGPTGPA
jgi:hypothetical protein